MRLIPKERIQQRTVEQIVVVSRISSRERNGGSGPDHSPERIIRDRIVDVTVMVQRQIPTIHTIQKTMEILQIQFLDRVVDVPVDEHIDGSCDCTSDFQMEVVSKEKVGEIIDDSEAYMRVEPAIVLTR